MEKNREIKFRAYDKTFAVMLSDVVVWDSQTRCIAVLDQPAQWAYGDKWDDRMDLNFEGSVPEWYCFTGGFELMQFTGLKDRNGVDIYEGDILKCDFSRDNNGLHDSIQVVEFYEGAFGSRNKDDHFRIPALFSGRATEGMNLNYYEVIGNHFENPELL